jgi:hypothetical protein
MGPQHTQLGPADRERYIIYTLGDPIRPPRCVKAGSLYRAARVWVALDLLLTCASVAEARCLTDERRQPPKAQKAQGPPSAAEVRA